MFHVGQKVVYVSGTFAAPRTPPEFCLRKSAIYTIRDVDTRMIAKHGVATIRIEEMFRPVVLTSIGPFERGYHPAGFRPILERKTDISIFTAMLGPQRALVNEELNV